MIPLYVRIPLLIAVGILAWAAVWTTTPQPRAAYDTLWYSRFAFEYAGAGREVAIRETWQVFERFGDPDRVAYIAERDGWPWQGESDPSRRRWIGIYQMRPLMPLVTAAACPWLSSGAGVRVRRLHHAPGASTLCRHVAGRSDDALCAPRCAGPTGAGGRESPSSRTAALDGAGGR